MDSTIQMQLVQLATRGVVALERIADAAEKSLEPASAGLMDMLLGMLQNITGASQEPPTIEEQPRPSDELCKCLHASDQHLQGEGPCLMTGCPCSRFDLMGKTPEPPKERDTKPDTPRAIRQASHSEMVSQAPGVSQKCVRCNHAQIDHLFGRCEWEYPEAGGAHCDCEGFVAA